MAGDDVKLPLFHGNETNDTEQYLFLCEAVWNVGLNQPLSSIPVLNMVIVEIEPKC